MCLGVRTGAHHSSMEVATNGANENRVVTMCHMSDPCYVLLYTNGMDYCSSYQPLVCLALI